jgi:hypothetical protein
MANTTEKFEETKEVSQVEAPKKARAITRIAPAFIAMAFMAMLSMAVIGPVSAEGINLSFVGPLFTSLFDAVTSIFPSFEDFIDAGFPLLIKIIVYVAIIGIIGMFLYFGRSVLESVVKMIGFGRS